MKKTFLLLLLFPILVKAQEFILPVMPDTQVEVHRYSDKYFNRMKWIVEKKDSIPFVLHIGDLVNYNNNVHWDNASEGYDILDNHNIKYAIAVGNHDCGAVGEFSGSAAPGNTNKNLRITDKFNRYFPRCRFNSQRGSFNKTTSDNSFYTFKAATANWLVLSIEFCPRPEVLEWANKIVAEHPQYNVIVQTHYYLKPDGKIADDNQGYGDVSPMQMFNTFIKKHKNILLVVSGHKCGSMFRKDKGDKGNTIYSVLQNHQCKDMGGGYIRLFYVDVNKKTIKSKTYSPHYKKYKENTAEVNFKNVNFIVSPER